MMSSRRFLGSHHRGSTSAFALLVGLLRILAPLFVIVALAFLVLTVHHRKEGYLRVTTSIPGAEIFVGGISSGLTTDTTFRLPVGRKIITVRKQDYLSDPEYAIVDVAARTTKTVHFILHDAGSAQQADRIPPYSPVRQEILSTGQPLRVIEPVPPRRGHRLVDYSKRAAAESGLAMPEASAGVSTSVAPAPQPEASSDTLRGTQVVVSSTPEAARILVNGRESGAMTPHTFRGLNRGVYFFSVRRDGYIAEPESVRVVLTRDLQTELVAFRLTPKVALSRPTITVTTVPLAAGIKLDGAPIGVGRATVETTYGKHVIEFADVPGFQTPAPTYIELTEENSSAVVTGKYERLVGRSFLALVAHEEMDKIDGSRLRVYVDGELLLDSPNRKFDALLLGRLQPGRRLVHIEYDDLAEDLAVNLVNDEAVEVVMRFETFFSKRKLRLRVKRTLAIEEWQQQMRKAVVHTAT